MDEEPFLPTSEGPNPIIGHSYPNAEADSEHGKHQPQNFPPLYVNFVSESRLFAWLPKTGSQVVEATLVWVFWIFGSDFQASDHKCIGYVFNCLAINMFWFLASQPIFELWPNRKNVLRLFAGLSISTVLLYTAFIISVLSEPIPHLQVGIALSQSNYFWLTNDCLFSADASKNTSWNFQETVNTNTPWLVIPVTTNQTELSFWPLLTNSPDADAENVGVTVQITSVNCSAEGDWSVHKEDMAHNTSLIWRDEFISKGHAFTLGKITISGRFPSDERWGMSRVPVVISIFAKHVPPVRLIFWLMLVPQPAAESGPTRIRFGVFCGDQVSFGTNGLIHFNYSKSQITQSN
jgi:hypothetical protein